MRITEFKTGIVKTDIWGATRTTPFPNALKIARVSPIFRSGDKLAPRANFLKKSFSTSYSENMRWGQAWSGDIENISSCRPMSALSCFSKILERITDNCLYNYCPEHKILCPRRFNFQTGHSTEYAITNVTDQILESFEKDFPLEIFIDLSKAFDTVDHIILLINSKCIVLEAQTRPGSAAFF